jgi:hypothetical protein
MKENLTYKMLPYIRVREQDGGSTFYKISDGIIVSKNSNGKNLCVKLKYDLNNIYTRYGFLNVDTNDLFVLSKLWLSDKDFYGSFENVEKAINSIIKESILTHDLDKNEGCSSQQKNN